MKQLAVKYFVLIFFVYMICSFIALSLNPVNWHIVVRIVAVFLILIGFYGIEYGITKQNN